MGLGDLLGRWRMKDPVDGTAQVLSCSARPAGSGVERCTMQLVARAERVAPVTVEITEKVPVERWPATGMTLPITLDRERPGRVRIRWDDVRVAAAPGQVVTTTDTVRSTHVETTVDPGEAPQVEVTSFSFDNIGQLTDEHRAKLREFGFDADAMLSGIQGGDPQAAFAQFFGSDFGQRIEKLQKLADLHAQGALTDEELGEQARKLFGA